MLYKDEFAWLEDDKLCAKAVAYLCAHSGYTETKERLRRMLSKALADDTLVQTSSKVVDDVFKRLLKRGVIEEDRHSPVETYRWRFIVKIVTEKGSPYKHKY